MNSAWATPAYMTLLSPAQRSLQLVRLLSSRCATTKLLLPINQLPSARFSKRAFVSLTLDKAPRKPSMQGWVSPFGHPRIKARLPAPRGFSQAATSFIACHRQGIHHMRLLRLILYLWNPKGTPKHRRSRTQQSFADSARNPPCVSDDTISFNPMPVRPAGTPKRTNPLHRHTFSQLLKNSRLAQRSDDA